MGLTRFALVALLYLKTMHSAVATRTPRISALCVPIHLTDRLRGDWPCALLQDVVLCSILLLQFHEDGFSKQFVCGGELIIGVGKLFNPIVFHNGGIGKIV